ncbi:hypothetical protein [Priestia megaterium]|uniref:hypothetical protein n=1 Tax=Priestia megaterium TaxID=1404 RepID=UPI00112A1706|nr:hypothetical protein [Priestia megaterium]TPF18007.1 hypothetical protein CBE78_01925 [Priestia megaterium]TPF22114.1 hypothetical protein CBE79_04430 [Priestia megaterium]
MKIKIDKVKKGLLIKSHIREVIYKGERYKYLGEEGSQIGDIALSKRSDGCTTKGEFYQLIECYSPDGFKGFIADDGYPCGAHDNLHRFIYYRKK